MRIEVRTRQGVRVHLDLSKVTRQTEVITDEGTHYLVHSEGGQTTDLEAALLEIEIHTKDLRTHEKPPETFLDKLSRH